MYTTTLFVLVYSRCIIWNILKKKYFGVSNVDQSGEKTHVAVEHTAFIVIAEKELICTFSFLYFSGPHDAVYSPTTVNSV